MILTTSTLFCDREGCEARTVPLAACDKDLRAYWRERGWRRIRDEDYCPEHVKVVQCEVQAANEQRMLLRGAERVEG